MYLSPVVRSVFRRRALERVVVKHLSVHAAQLSNVLAEVARDEALATLRVREARVGERLIRKVVSKSMACGGLLVPVRAGPMFSTPGTQSRQCWLQ